MSCSTPVSSYRRQRRQRTTPKTTTPALSPLTSSKRDESLEEDKPEEEFFLSQVPSTEDGVYWAFDNPELDEELHKKMAALDEASPTCRKKVRSTPKFRLRLAGTQRRNNENQDEEAKQFLSQCFGDFINKKKKETKIIQPVISDPRLSKEEPKESDTSNVFDEDEEEFLLLASQAVDSSLSKKTPVSMKKDFNRRKLTDPFEDDSFDTLLSQLPDDAFNKSSPKFSRLSLKRHGTSDDLGTPKSTKSLSRTSSFRRNNSAPVIESPPEVVIPCTHEEIMKKKEAALQKRLLKQNKNIPIESKMKQEIEMKRREALRRRNLLQNNTHDV